MSLGNRELDLLVLEAEPLIADLRSRCNTDAYRDSVRATKDSVDAALEAMHSAAKSLALLKLDGRHRSYINLCFSPNEPETDAVTQVVNQIQETAFGLKYLSLNLVEHTFSTTIKRKYEKSLPQYLDETIEFINFFERRTGENTVFPKRDTAIGRDDGWETDYKYIDQSSTYFLCKCLQKLDPEENTISRAITLIRYALEHQEPAKRLVEEILSRKD